LTVLPNNLGEKGEGDLDGDLYHCICNSNLTDYVQNNAENKGTHHALAEFGKTLSNQPQHPHHLQKHIRSREVQTLLPSNQLDVIDNDSHLGHSFVHPSSLVPLLGYSQSGQSVFAIQVRITGPPSVGITKSALFANQAMEEYKIQLPASMVKVNKGTTMRLRAPVVLDIGQCFPSNNQPRSTNCPSLPFRELYLKHGVGGITLPQGPSSRNHATGIIVNTYRS
jgi:hypothetical protein